jgi:hypothetical protein
MQKAKLGRKPIYDWDKLVDGKPHEFTHGADFDCDPSSFAALVRHTAKRRGRKVEVSVDGDYVFFRFLGTANASR